MEMCSPFSAAFVFIVVRDLRLQNFIIITAMSLKFIDQRIRSHACFHSRESSGAILYEIFSFLVRFEVQNSVTPCLPYVFTNHMALVCIISSSPMEVLSGGSQSTYAYASLGPTRDG